jgi:hypothetical protein
VTHFCSAGHAPVAKAILTEMKHYGMILTDNGSTGSSRPANPQWPDSGGC